MLIYPKIGLMNLIVFLFLIPLSFAEILNPPTCAELGDILLDYEKGFATSKLADCKTVKAEDLAKGHPDLPLDEMKSRMCQPLSAIEAEIEKKKAELAIADGIKKLKDSVAQSKTVAESGVKVDSFVSNLKIAQTIEILLSSQSPDGESFLAKIKKLPENKRATLDDLKNAVSAFCDNKKSSDNNACNPKLFNPDTFAAHEVYEMIQDNNVSKTDIDKWTGLMSIKHKDGTPWSFTQMQAELGPALAGIDQKLTNPKEVRLTREHLNAIKQLDNFIHGDSFYGKDILAMKEVAKPAIMPEKFLMLMGDAKARQEYEAKSKLSIAYQNYGDQLKLTPQQASDCEAGRLDVKKARACHDHMLQASNNLTDKDFKDSTLKGILNSLDYADTLGKKIDSCTGEYVNSAKIPDACYSELADNSNELQQKIRQLIILKDKIGSQQEDKMKYRNFTLKLWSDKCSQNAQKSFMDQCEAGELGLSNAMVAETMKIALVFSPKSDAETGVQDLCANKNKDGKPFRDGYEKKLCDSFSAKPGSSNGPVTVPPKDDEDPKKMPKIDLADVENKARAMNAGKNLLTDALKSWLNYKYPQNGMPYYTNPYPYNYSPYNYGTPPMGIADSIMFNARYYGSYGYYMPTPGYQPYTAFGSTSAMSAYKPASPAYPSAYFSK